MQVRRTLKPKSLTGDICGSRLQLLDELLPVHDVGGSLHSKGGGSEEVGDCIYCSSTVYHCFIDRVASFKNSV